MERKTKELHYKIADMKSTSMTLQEALHAALKQRPLPEQRLEHLGTNNDEGQVLLDPRSHGTILCLTMGSFVKGTLQPIMGMAPDQRVWPIRQIEPPKLPGTSETEFLDGYLFMGVWKNHVVMLQTRSCNSEQLENHLNWLLRKLPHWPTNALVSLNDRSPKELRDKSFQRVHAFKLEAGLQACTVHLDEKTTRGGVKVRPFGKNWDALVGFLGQFGGKLPEDVLLDESFDPRDLHIKVEVVCRKKGIDRSGPLLDVLANSLRHITTDIVKIEFEDGSELKGSDLKTRTPIRIQCSGNMPVVQQVDKAIHDYLQQLIERDIVK